MGQLVSLTVLKEGRVILTTSLESQLMLGRADDCQIKLDGREVSRQHALFRKVGDKIQVEKKSEFAPLAVNGAESSQSQLKDGDIITIGPYLIRVQVTQEVVSKEKAASAAPNAAVSSPAPAAQPAESADPQAVSEASPEGGGGEQMPEAGAFGDGGQPAEGNVGGEPGVGEDPLNSQGQPENSDSNGEAQSSEAPQDAEFEPIDEDGKTKFTSAAQLSVKLIFKPDTANHTTYELQKDEISIGRGKDCDIVLNDKKASRKHALIRKAGLSFSIKDLESANGTYLNGEKIDERELSGDDVIRIGAVEFQFKAVSADYEANKNDFLSVPDEPVEESQDFAAEPDPALGGEVPQDQAAVPMGIEGMDPAAAGAGIPNGAANAGQPAGGDLGAISGGIPGITGLDGGGKKKTLMERFRSLPKPAQLVLGLAVIGLLFWANQDDEPANNPKNGKVAKGKPSPGPDMKGPKTFEMLSEHDKQFVKAQHELAFNYYRNGDYDKALYEVRRIFPIVQNYQQAREIEEYSLAGQRKREAQEEEKRKKEEEEKLRAKILDFMNQAKRQMAEKKYEDAKETFAQILSLDPDNTQVASWRKEIENYEEQLKLTAQQKQIQEEINKTAWATYQEAIELKKERRYHSAIEVFQKAIDIGASDKRVITQSKQMIAACKSSITRARDPVLQEAKKQEEAGEFAKAYDLYHKATRIDPPHPAGYAGMERVKGVLHTRAKTAYTEAILAESYSDFETARKMFQECMSIAPPGDIYHERALRKLSHYIVRKGEAQ